VRVPLPLGSRFGAGPRYREHLSWKTAKPKISIIDARQFHQRGALNELRNFVQAISQ